MNRPERLRTYFGIAAGLSIITTARVRERGAGYEWRVARRQREAADSRESWANRLRAAAVIP